jgi:ferredoxin
MGVKVDALKCIGCMACEMACGYHRDDGFAFLSACIVLYRGREKKDYFGVLLKEEENLVVFRPEGTEVKKIGATDDEPGDQKEGDASAKPMLLREACDLCEGMETRPHVREGMPRGRRQR